VIDYDFGAALGALNSTHMERVREWRNDEKIIRWCRQTDLISDTEQQAWFDRQSKDASIKMYSVFHGPDMVGVCGFTSIDPLAAHAEFSLYVSSKFQGKGIGTKALKTLFNHGFLSLGLNQIWGEVLAGNPALALFEKLGMKKDGTRRDVYFKNGRLCNSSLVSILKSEWITEKWSLYSSVSS